MEHSPAISSLLPDIFNVTRPLASGTDPLIISASLLILEEVQMLPIVEGLEPKLDPETKIRMYATLGGYSVLRAISGSKSSDYLKLLWTKCMEMPVWVGSLNFEDTLDELLRVIALTNFGNVVIDGRGNVPALLTLREIADLYGANKIKSELRASEIGSERVSISSDSSITDTLNLMLKMKIRRVFHSGSYGDRLQFVSSRSIIKFLFSPHRLEIVKKSPEKWLDAKVSEVLSSSAKFVFDGATMKQCAKLMGDKVDDCLVCEASNKVVSRWDIVMKPWKEGKMEVMV
jgi:hypothetical protein